MTTLKVRKSKSSILYEDLKESLDDILSYERGTSNLKFVEDTVTVENKHLNSTKANKEIVSKILREKSINAN